MRVFGKYRLLEPLASGGMADVWRAEGMGAEGVVKEVALKLVRGEHAARSDFVRMFIEEARLAARLSHANVVQIFDFDQVDGRYYIAMELVRGHHLAHVVERARQEGVRVGLPRAVHLVAEVAKGLAHAHRLSEGGRPLGLVHRDVSPHNVLVSFEGEVKLTDFGIARAMNRAGLTEPGTLKGKVAYMAPEQARGGVVDARADVFSLGVILWELCAGRRLFARDSEAASLAAVLGDEPVSPPSAWNEAVPPELDAVVLGALERHPERRTASADAFAAALSGLLFRIARAPEEVDVRAFMRRLWPDGDAARPAGLEATRVREAPVVFAAEEVAPVAAVPSLPRPGAPSDDAETATRTVAAPPGGRRRARVAAAIGAGALAVSIGGALGIRAARTPAAPSRPAPVGSPDPGPPEPPIAAPAAAPPTPAPGSPARSWSAAAVGSDSVPGSRAPAGEIASAASAGAPRAPSAPPPPGESVQRLYGLRLPAASTGEGLLSVNVTPWATLYVNGVRVGDTPREVRLRSGRHRVRVQHPTLGTVEAAVWIEAGRRSTWFPQLARRKR